MTEVNKQADASGGDEAERERLLVEQLPQVRYIAPAYTIACRVTCCWRISCTPGSLD